MSNTIRPPFPTVVNSTLISAFRSCPQKAYRSFLEHWKPGTGSVHLVAGKAFAAGLEVAREAFYIHQQPPEDALALGVEALWREYGYFECPADSAKSPLRMAGALEAYFDQYPLGADGAPPHIFKGAKHGIEFNFTEPLPTVRHPETGDPILYTGRADMVCDAFGGLFLYDEKTTSQLGPSWLKKWEHRSQFTAYCWGLRGYGYRPTGIIVRGVSILKDAYGHAQAVTYRADWEVERWLEQTERDLRRMIACWETGVWDYNLDEACVEFGSCSFIRVCKSPNPEQWLPIYHQRRLWDPVTRTETLLESPT